MAASITRMRVTNQVREVQEASAVGVAGHVRLPSLDSVVREIYGSLGEEISFDRVLSAVGGSFRSHITALHLLDLEAGRAQLKMAAGWSASELTEAAEAYATRWTGQNLWMERGMEDLIEKGYGIGDEVVSELELVRSEYYRHFLKPVDIHFGLGIKILCEAGSQLAVVTLNRSKCAGAYRRHELQLVEQLRPHLINAYCISRRLNESVGALTSLRQAFDHAPIGMLVLDAGGHVLEQNAEASRLMTSKAGISCAPDRTLRAACPSARARLGDALRRLGRECDAPMPECLIIGKPGAGGSTSLALHLCAFPGSESPALVRNGRILGFLCELGRQSEDRLHHQVLQAALKLTPMEATVVMALREHNDPLSVALQLSLAISTVRTHLKHVFWKTGTTRQSELLRLTDGLLLAAPKRTSEVPASRR